MIFSIFYGVPEVREVSKKLPGARGFVVIEYGPVGSHGDPIQPRNYQILTLPNMYTSRFVNVFLEIRIVGKRYGHPNGVKLMRIGCPHRPTGVMGVNLSPEIHFSRKTSYIVRILIC